MERQVVVQIALDIVATQNEEGEREIDEEKVAKDLESLGYVVLGSKWKATWSMKNYERGKGPDSWD